MASITREFIEAQVAALLRRREQLQADGNAVNGAIQAWRVALEQIDATEIVNERPGPVAIERAS